MSTTHYEVGKNLELSKKIHKHHADNSSSSSSSHDAFLLAKYSSLGYYLVTPFLLGVFFGFWIDVYFKTKPTFTLIGIAIGFISTVYNLYKLLTDEKS